jgi:hypothetical protein
MADVTRADVIEDFYANLGIDTLARTRRRLARGPRLGRPRAVLPIGSDDQSRPLR